MPFADYAKKILFLEKGLVEDPNDPGGLTNYGISHRAHPYLTRQEILDMTPERATEIYKSAYWKPTRGDAIEELNPQLALFVLDMAVHSGPVQAVKTLQRTLKYLGQARVKIDGLMGPLTLAGIAGCEKELLYRVFGAHRMIFLSNLPNWSYSKNGWIMRLSTLELRQ